jgi:hypothetical protein
MSFKKKNLYFIIFIFSPLLTIAFLANFSFVDSSNFFFKTLLSGKLFYMYSADWPYYNPILHENRFQPFVGIFQNIILFFDLYKNQKSIYLVQLIIFLTSLIFIIKTVNKNFFSTYLVFFTFILSPPFIFSFAQPLLTETTLIFFISIYIFLLKRIYLKASVICAILIIILIPIIILSKISSIILLLSINFFLIYFSLKSRNKFYLFFLFCFIFSLLIYFLLISYTGKAQDKFYNPKDFFFYYIQTDFILIYIYFICLTSLIYKYNSYKTITFQNGLFISLLLTSLIYFVALISFGKHSEYQQVICYLLVIPYLVNLNLDKKYFTNRRVVFSTLLICLLVKGSFYKIILFFFFINLLFYILKIFFTALNSNYIVSLLISLSLFYLIIPGISLSYHRFIIGKNIENAINSLEQKKINSFTQIFLHSTNNSDCSETIMHNFIFNERLSFLLKKDYILFANPISNFDDCKMDLEYFEKNYSSVNIYAFQNYKYKNMKNEPDLIISNYYDDKNNLYNFLLMNNINPEKYELSQYQHNQDWNIYYKIISKISSFRIKTPIIFLLKKIDY